MNFIKGSIFTIISKAMMFISSLFISIYVARILGPEAKGMYYLLVQLVSIVVLFGMFGIDNSAIYFLGKQRISQPTLFSNILFLTLLSSVIFFVFTIAFHSFLIKSIMKGVPEQYVLVMTFAIPLLMFNQIFLSLILGLNRILMYNVSQMICYFLLFLNFVILVIGLGFGIYGAYLSFTVTYLMMDCIYIFLLIRKIKPQIQRKNIGDILHYAVRGFLGPICLLLIFKVDSFILNIFSDIRQVGFYSIAVSFAELLPFVPLAVGTILFPKLASQEEDALNISTARVIRVITSFLLLLVLIFLAFGKWLILFIYGQMYASSVMPMYILLPGYIFISLYYLFFSYFNAIGKPEISTVILIITLVIKSILSVFAIARWNIAGAAAASSVSYLFCGMLFIIAFGMKSKKTLRGTLLVKSSDIKYLWNIFSSAWAVNKG